MKEPFVPEDFVVPAIYETEQFRLRMLCVEDVVLDYDAVMTSRDHLHSVFGTHTGWPADDLTIEQDLADLHRHQQEFETRVAFAYTVVSLDESLCLGCVYINPTLDPEPYDSRVYLWVRKSELEKGLDAELFAAVKAWIARDWPFKNVAYPGRDIDWPTWEALGYKRH